jgi:hypothetical protein
MSIVTAVLIIALSGSIAMTETNNYSIDHITVEIQHQADKKKYPNYVKESYTLNNNGILKYGAYFGGVPTSMNHNDGINWNSGDQGRKVFLKVLAMLKKPLATTGFVIYSDTSKPACNDKVYFLSIEKDNSDITCFVENPKTPAYKEIDRLFSDLIHAFEKETGRPLKVSDLPQ